MEDKTLLDYWLILYRRRWLILLMAAASMITAGFISHRLTPVYEAKSVMFVPATPDIASYLSPGGDISTRRHVILPMADDEPHAPYIGLLKSRSMRELVHKEYPHKTSDDLNRDVDFALSDEYLLSVFVRDGDPVEAAEIANAYVKIFNELLGSYSLSLADRNRIIIEGEIDHIKEKLGESRHALKEFQRSEGVISPQEYERYLINQRSDFQTKLNDARIQRKENESAIAAMINERNKEMELFASEDFSIESNLLEMLRRDLSQIAIDMSGMRADIKEAHPDFIKLKYKYDEIKASINAEINRIVKGKIKRTDTLYETIRRDLVNLLVEQQRIDSSLQAYEAILKIIEERIQDLPDIVVRIQSLLRETAQYESMLRNLELNLEEMTIQNRRDLQAVVMVDEATPPLYPVFPYKILNILVAGFAGLAAGIFYCFFVNYLEETSTQRLYKIVKSIESNDN